MNGDRDQGRPPRGRRQSGSAKTPEALRGPVGVPLVVLVVEDNPADVVLLTEAVEHAGVAVRLHVVEDGQEALEYLSRCGPQSSTPRPGLIALDLNLPIKSGREVLAEIAATPDLHDIPVAVLTTSKTEADICGQYPGGRCRYFIKTGDFSKLVEIVRDMVRFAQSVLESARAK